MDRMKNFIHLGEIAHARSGDKGNHANIGVIAFTPEGYRYLGEELTEKKVAGYFRRLQPTEVRRYELPGVLAYNFVLFNVLGGGASRSLRIDSQGKTLALALLEMPVEPPRQADLERMRRQPSKPNEVTSP
jgi:hypothetical protein